MDDIAIVAQPDELEAAIRANWRPFAAAAVFSGAINLLYLSSPLYLTQVYNRVLTSGSVSTLFSLTVVLAVAVAVMALLEAIRARVLTRTTGRVDTLLSGRVFEAIVDRVGRSGLSTQNSQALRDLDQVRATLSGPAVQFLFDAPWLPIFLLILFMIHWLLGFVGLLGAVVLIVLAIANERVTRASVGSANDAAGRSYLYADVIARAAEVVRALGLVGPVRERWAGVRQVMLAEQVTAADRGADMIAGTRFARLMLQSLMLGTGAYLSLRHSIQPATIFAASIILGRALSPVEQAIGAWRSLTTTEEAVGRIRKLLHASPPPPQRALRDGFDGRIEVEHLTYVVPGRRDTVLHDLSFEIAPGDAVGIIGPSGAGKSTLARLLVGGVAPTEGEVRLGGAPLDHWAPESLGNGIGYLPQDVQLLPGTLRDNIGRLGRASEDEVRAAVRRAGVEQLISDLPQGLDTDLGDAGLGLSGGQRQRIGLARAIVGEPRLLVLDEPNANLDVEGEEALAAAMEEMRRLGATLVVVTHRPSALDQVDTLLLLREGRLEAMGPKAELIDRLRAENRPTPPPKAARALREVRAP